MQDGEKTITENVNIGFVFMSIFHLYLWLANWKRKTVFCQKWSEANGSAGLSCLSSSCLLGLRLYFFLHTLKERDWHIMLEIMICGLYHSPLLLISAFWKLDESIFVELEQKNCQFHKKFSVNFTITKKSTKHGDRWIWYVCVARMDQSNWKYTNQLVVFARVHTMHLSCYIQYFHKRKCTHFRNSWKLAFRQCFTRVFPFFLVVGGTLIWDFKLQQKIQHKWRISMEMLQLKIDKNSTKYGFLSHRSLYYFFHIRFSYIKVSWDKNWTDKKQRESEEIKKRMRNEKIETLC